MKIVLLLHTLTQSFRHAVILSGFGSISYCKQTPTCSEYTLAAIQRDGVFMGFVKGTWRVLRCW